jgi:CheY-like chemotaxis protein
MTKVKDLHIIIAEDDYDDAEVIEQSFANNPDFIKVDLVKNGEELLAFLRDSHTLPDIVLTDINMPIMNGMEALKEISDDPALSGLPCFVYSTSINPVYEAKCKELGIKGFLIKPYTLEEFDDIPKEIVSILSAM